MRLAFGLARNRIWRSRGRRNPPSDWDSVSQRVVRFYGPLPGYSGHGGDRRRNAAAIRNAADSEPTSDKIEVSKC